MWKLAVSALVALSFSLAACSSDDPQTPEKGLLTRGASTDWVATEPIQCLGNPWERDWVDRHPDQHYPRDPTWPRRLTDEEIAIIRDFYAKQGVVVFEAKARARYDVVCLSCDCAEGHTLYLLVRAADIETMIDLGYRVEWPLK